MVLVTGAAGHLGTALVRELVEGGEKVRVFVLPDEDISSLNGLPLVVARGNVLDRESLKEAMAGVDTVYHLAGIISIMPGRNEKMRQVNVVGTSNVARLARELGVRRMVYVSSIHALGRPARGTPIDETVPFDPHNSAGEYDQTKAEASLAVLAEAAKGLDAVIICPTGIIGPYHFRGGSPMSGQMRKWMRPGWHVVINGHFDFVDVRDVARGMVLASKRGTRGETYIIRGQHVSVTELLGMVKEVTGNKGAVIPVPFRLALLSAWFATLHSRLWHTTVQFTRYALETLASNSDISGEKARLALGYGPRPIRDTVRDTVQWLADNPPRPALPPVRRNARPQALRAPRQAAAFARASRIAVVTGASSGIGAVTARRLAESGYRVVMVARREDKLRQIAKEIEACGGAAEILAADLSKPQGIRAVYDRVIERGEGIDVLVNNAGFGWYGYASDMPSEIAREMINVNNAALTELIVMFLPLMRGGGRGHVINVSSIVGGFPSPWAALYSATKSFIDTLTTALHRELRGTGVHVSAVRPGPVLTEFYQSVIARSEGRAIPVERFVPPEAVANAIMRLLVHPRRAVYVPKRFWVIPWLEFGFGWLIDRVAVLLMRRQATTHA
jgi:dihydroflavonol-4-reductase